jgi:hypothetical protein
VKINQNKDQPEERQETDVKETEVELDRECRKVFSGIKESNHSRWTLEFSRRFGPG